MWSPAGDAIQGGHAEGACAHAVIVAPIPYDDWLDNVITGKQEFLLLLDSERSGELVSYPVSSRVNSPAHGDCRRVQPVDPAG